MKARSLIFATIALVAVIVMIWALSSTRVPDLTPVYMTIESVVKKFHQSERRWPTSYQEAIDYAHEDEKRIISRYYKSEIESLDFLDERVRLHIVYHLKSSQVHRYVWFDGRRYRAGLKYEQ